MSSFTLSPNMNLPISIIGQTQDPEWESNLNESQTLIDSHDHDGQGNGVQLQPTAISFANGGFDFEDTPQLNATYYQIVQTQGSTPPVNPTTGFGELYVDDNGDLHYVSPTIDIPITANGSLITISNGFSGDYQISGGNAYYNATSASWPFAGTFYFYTATTTPTDDSGTRAGLAAAFVDVKGDFGVSTYSPGIYFTLTNIGATEGPFYGPADFGSGLASWGLSIGLSNGSGEFYSPAIVSHETADSSIMSTSNPTATLARTYLTSLNGLISNGTAIDNFAFGARAVSYAGAASGDPVQGAYFLASLADGSGVPQAPGANFGFALDWRVQFDGTDFTHNAVAVRTIASFWTGAAGAFTIVPYNSSVANLLAFEAGVATDLGTSIGIGTNADRTTSRILFGTQPTTFLATLVAVQNNFDVGGNEVVSGTLGVTGKTTLNTLEVVSTSAFDQTATFSTTAIMPSISVTGQTTNPGQGVFNYFSFVTAYANFNDGGSIQVLNCTVANTSAGINVVTVPWVVTTNSVRFAVINDGTTVGIAVSQATVGSSTVYTITNSGFVNKTVTFVLIGG